MQKTVSFTKNATNVFFHILTGCNLKCRHCYINQAQQGTHALDITTIEAWLSAFASKGRQANVIFLGGEPTLHPDLALAAKKARKLGYSSITIDTNGYLFNEILSKVTPDEVDFFSFSLDGVTRETNDGIRGNGCYDKCLAGIKRAVRSGFHTSLIYTVNRMNIQELPLIVPLLSDLKIDRFFIQVIGLRGKCAKKNLTEKDPANLQVSRSEWLSVIPDVASRAAKQGIRVTYPKVYLDLDETFECAGLVAHNYFIFPNGRVYRCPLCEDFPLHSLFVEKNRLVAANPVNETDLFKLRIPEGCVMNKIVQPDNIIYTDQENPEYQIACCMLKEEVQA